MGPSTFFPPRTSFVIDCLKEDDMKRLLDLTPQELVNLDKENLIKAIAMSEGRVMAAETIGITQPVLTDVTNAELASAMGADIIILNLFDVLSPRINALPECSAKDTVRMLKRLIGRPVGINLEPVDMEAIKSDGIWKMSAGRCASVENALLSMEMGVDFIVLTGNPGNGVSNAAIASSLRKISKETGNRMMLVAGKMHASGVLGESGERIITKDDTDLFIDSGADMILMPAPGTVPGITTEYIRSLVSHVHERGKLAITSVGTSQEGSDADTIRRIALECKMTGTDVHHLGDSGYLGMALAENITTYSTAIRGIRHTWHRMAQSLAR